MRRFRINKTTRLGDMEASAPSLKQAEERLRDAVEKAVTGAYAPVYVSGYGLYSLVYRTPQGYMYSSPTSHGEEWDCVSTCADFHDGKLRAQYHLAQNAFRLERNDNEIAKIIDDETERADFLRWAAWQRDYARLKAEGYDDTYCFNHAKIG